MQQNYKSNLKSSKPRVLMLPLEFATWQRARSWTYAIQLGFEEGFISNNVDFFTIPVLQEAPSSSPASWLHYAHQLCKDRKFDQVWIWLVHPAYDEAFLRWLKEVAPIRVGFLMESIEYSKQELEQIPVLKERQNVLENQLPYMTHILACDEADAERIDRRGVCKALWFPSAVPEKFLASSAVVSNGEAIFCGASYGDRDKWLKHFDLQALLVSKVSGEHSTEYPALFDRVNREVMNFLQHYRIADEAVLLDHLNVLRSIRRACFKLWLKGLQTGCAVVNLPHLFKGYAGRVVEAMAAGRPVISWEIPDRPRNRSLFENGKEILLFDESKPEELANHTRRVQNDTDFARHVAENALQKVRVFHTIEERIQQVLGWIGTGVEPAFGEVEENQEFQHESQEAVLVAANSVNRELSRGRVYFDKLVESGEIAFAEGQYNKAAKFYHKALECNPNVAHLWNNMGYLAMKVGDSTAAKKAFTHALTVQTPDRKAQTEALDQQQRQGKTSGILQTKD